jgi:hypothetical protein
VDAVIGELAERQHGVVGRRQLLALGVSRSAIEGRLARRQLYRLYRGAYAVGYPSVGREGRWLAAVIASGPGAVLSHRAAAQHWRLIPPRDAVPETTVPRGWRSPAGVRVHRASLREDEITDLDGIPVTEASRTLFDLAAARQTRQLERAFHEAEVRRLTSRVSVRALMARYPGRPGAVALAALLGSKAPAGITQNDFEELFVAFLDDHGLPRPLLNGTLPVRGRLLRPDCMWPEQRLLVELDGAAVHRTERAFESDRQRDRTLLAEGWRSTRVTWRQLQDEPAAIAADLREALGASRHPHPHGG